MQRHRQPANCPAILEEINRVPDEHAPLRLVPTWIEGHVEPTRQPIENVLRRAAHVEQNLRGGDSIFQGGMHTFKIGEKSIEKRGRLIVFPIHGRQIICEVREARVVRAQSRQARRAALVAAQAQLQLQIAAARALKQQFPGTVADLPR